jgi:CheY-like chemotaxis protein/two-component sensor histidine kinase
MSSAVDVLKAREGNPGRELVVLSRQLSHLSHVVDELVDASRITKGTISLRREVVELAAALTLAIDTVRPLLDSRGHVLVIDVPRDLVVDADPHRLTQVLVNLLDNAAAYTPAGGRIEVSATLTGAHVDIVVRDNGRGIPAALLPHVFEVFVQGERSQARQEGGLGIGLALVENLVALHGGTVTAHSDGEGTGSTFTVRWPLTSPETPTGAMPPVVRPERSAPLRILMVDDNVDAAELLGEAIRWLGHEVVVVNEAQLALEAAAELSPQIAILDIGLPVVDGYELARRLHALPNCASTILIALTGYGQQRDRERAKAAGFTHHLVKPVELKVLTALLTTDLA